MSQQPLEDAGKHEAALNARDARQLQERPVESAACLQCRRVLELDAGKQSSRKCNSKTINKRVRRTLTAPKDRKEANSFWTIS